MNVTVVFGEERQRRGNRGILLSGDTLLVSNYRKWMHKLQLGFLITEYGVRYFAGGTQKGR
jgi:hypothetical protein